MLDQTTVMLEMWLISFAGHIHWSILPQHLCDLLINVYCLDQELSRSEQMFRDMSTALTGVLRSRAEAVNRMQSDPQDGDICISDDSDSSEEVCWLFTGKFTFPVYYNKDKNTLQSTINNTLQLLRTWELLQGSLGNRNIEKSMKFGKIFCLIPGMTFFCG